MTTIQKQVKRIVVKLGSSQIVDSKLRLKTAVIQNLARRVAALRKQNVDVVLVSSGAIALGMKELGEHKRPVELEALQARAAIGQATLMHVYSKIFKTVQLKCAQVLLTWDDLHNQARKVNASHTLNALLKAGVVPIINENDTTSTEEIKFGDNDKLSAMVAELLHAQRLILLSDVEGFLNDKKELMPEIKEITPEIVTMSGGTLNIQVARGGMRAKIDAVQIATNAGIPCIIASGSNPNVLPFVIKGEPVGTYFPAKDT